MTVERVFVIGGKSTISEDFIKSIDKSGLVRISGEDKFEMAEKVNMEIENLRAIKNSKSTSYADIVGVYNEKNYPDALSAIPFMYQVNKNSVTYLPMYPNVRKEIGGSAKYVFGGLNSVSKFLLEDIRFVGKDRYETATLKQMHIKVY